MKLHQAALAFVIVGAGFIVTAQISLVTKMQEENKRKTEYDCLVSAVNAAVEVAFSGGTDGLTGEQLLQTEEVFFQTLGVLWEGTTDLATGNVWRQQVPCLVLFEENGYYMYHFMPGTGYGWSELVSYENGQIPERFFSDTEALLGQYHSLQYVSSKKYRMERAGKGIWEQSITPPCVFAIYAPKTIGRVGECDGFLYAASGSRETAYYVTEDNYCHLPFCEYCKTGPVVARYTTQKESAEDGAIPCAYCMK